MKPLFTIILPLSFIFMAEMAQAQPDTAWTNLYGGPVNEYFFNTVATPDGGLAIWGSFSVRADSSYNGILRLDAQGDSIWMCPLDIANRSLALISEGESLISVRAVDVFPCDLNIAWINSSGQIVNQRTFRRFGQFPSKLHVTRSSDNGIIFAMMYDGISQNTKNIILKTSDQGDSLWYRELAHEYEVGLSGIVPDNSGGCFVIGNISFDNESDVWITRLGNNGETVWDSTYGGRGSSYVKAAWKSNNSGFLTFGKWIEGDSICFTQFDLNGRITHISNSVNLLLNEYHYAPIRLQDGSYLFSRNDGDAFIQKLDPNGSFKWEKMLGGQGDESEQQWVQTNDGTLTGVIESNSFYRGRFPNYDLWIVKLTAENDVYQEPSAFPFQTSLLSAYPNPFNSSTVIEYAIDRPGFVKLGVYDLSGRMVKKLTNGFSLVTSARIVWNGSNLPAGQYQILLTTSYSTNTKVITLVK